MITRSYNNIIDRMQAFADGHFILQRFTHGQIDEVDITKENVYPWMHAVPTGFSLDSGEHIYSFDIYFADIPRDKEQPREYQREAISDMMQIACDFVNEIENGQVLFGSDVQINRPVTITPFIREFSNTLSGVTLTVDIIVPYQWNACDIPADYAVGGPNDSSGTGTTGGGITLQVNGTDNDVQTLLNLVEGTNINIVDNGDGSVTISATGSAGGGVESVTGLNTDNTDPLNPVIEISVDGTTITGAGTPASPLVAAGASPQGLQDVISEDAVLTQANTIDVNGQDLTFDDASKFSINSTGNQTFQRVNGGNSQALTLNGSVASIFYVTGSSERGFAAASGSAMIVTTKVKNMTGTVRMPLLLANTTTGDVEFDSLTTADVAGSTNRRYVTDAQLTVISNTSGTNTGDQDLSGLVVKNPDITGATKTKITYDTKGLVTSGADATTADIADSSNKRYVTDAQLTVIGNTSGTNTGDETGTTIRSKLGITTLSGSNTGDQTILDSYPIGSGGTFNPSDGLTYYIGSAQSMALAPTATAGARRIYSPTARTIVGVALQVIASGINGSGESVSVFVRVNNTTDTTVTTSMTWNAGIGAYNLLNVTGLNIALAAGDYYEIKIVCPTWVTNPTTVVMSGTVTYRH